MNWRGSTPSWAFSWGIAFLFLMFLGGNLPLRACLADCGDACHTHTVAIQTGEEPPAEQPPPINQFHEKREVFATSTPEPFPGSAPALRVFASDDHLPLTPSLAVPTHVPIAA